MKRLIVLPLFFLALSVNANIDYLKQSVMSSFAVIAQGHSLDEVEAIQAMMGAHDVETLALIHDEARGHEEILEFGCHLHGSQMACHPHGHSHLKGASFNEFMESINLSFNAIQKSFSARGIPSHALEGAKFWKAAHSHLIGQDEVFGKFVYEVNGADEVIFTECHRHGANDPIDCHFAFSGEDEPDFGGGHQH